jgi:hypothetical protein
VSWNILDLWENKGKKRDHEATLLVDGIGRYTTQLDFIPKHVHAHFIKEHDHPSPSCVPIEEDVVEITNYFSLIEIKWAVKHTRKIAWKAKG